MPGSNLTSYSPIQPAVTRSHEQLSYSEYAPAPALQPYIYCYWQLRSNSILNSSFPYRVVADGCMDIFFELQDPAQSFVMGCSNSYTEFPLGHSFHYVGIRFLPAQFPMLFGIKASELSNRSETLDIVLPSLAGYLKEAIPLLQPEDIQNSRVWHTLDHYFLQHLDRVTLRQDHRFSEALDLILNQSGNLQVQKDLDTGISPRQLRRLFDQYIGDTPKAFSRIVRFQHLLRLTGKRKDSTFLDAGYYDQAHFIREFRNFYGDTPANVFR